MQSNDSYESSTEDFVVLPTTDKEYCFNKSRGINRAPCHDDDKEGTGLFSNLTDLEIKRSIPAELRAFRCHPITS